MLKKYIPTILLDKNFHFPQVSRSGSLNDFPSKWESQRLLGPEPSKIITRHH